MITLTISAAARLCRCDRRTLQRAIHAGRLHLDAQHCLSREELIATGYLIIETPQEEPHSTPHETPRGTPQYEPHATPQEVMHATALVALLERLTTAMTDLHAEVYALREDLQHLSQRTPQGRRRGARITPQEAPHSTPQSTPHETPHTTPPFTPQGTPHPSPQILGIYDPQAAAIRIRDLRRQGLSYAMIALQLTREGIPTRYGKPWEHSSVRYIHDTYGTDTDAP